MLARLKDRSKGSVDVVQSKSQDDLLRMTRGEWPSAEALCVTEYTRPKNELMMCKVTCDRKAC